MCVRSGNPAMFFRMPCRFVITLSDGSGRTWSTGNTDALYGEVFANPVGLEARNHQTWMACKSAAQSRVESTVVLGNFISGFVRSPAWSTAIEGHFRYRFFRSLTQFPRWGLIHSLLAAGSSMASGLVPATLEPAGNRRHTKHRCPGLGGFHHKTGEYAAGAVSTAFRTEVRVVDRTHVPPIIRLAA